MANDELYEKLKAVTDYYIQVLHDIKGYHLDALLGFQAYLKNFEQQQIESLALVNIPILEMDKAQMIYSTGAPDDPNALMMHECTQGELKERLKKGGFNENFTGNFAWQLCTVLGRY